MQLDVGSEPYLSTAQVLCLFISHISSTSKLQIGRGLLHGKELFCDSMTRTYSSIKNTSESVIGIFPICTYEGTDRRTESDAYAPTCAYCTGGL